MMRFACNVLDDAIAGMSNQQRKQAATRLACLRERWTGPDPADRGRAARGGDRTGTAGPASSGEDGWLAGCKGDGGHGPPEALPEGCAAVLRAVVIYFNTNSW